jgi:hypothetical protein
MIGSNSSVHAGNHGDGEPLVSWAELHHMTGGQRLYHRDPEEFYREESGDENSSFGHGFELFGDDCRGFGDVCHANFDNPRGRRRAHGHRVRFEDEVFEDHDREDGSDENPFANDGMFGLCHHHRHADFEDRDRYHGRRHRNDPDIIARVKLDIPKFTGKDNAGEYLNWAEQCDQIFRAHNLLDQHRVNLTSVEFFGYALTWWNQVQVHQLRLGLRHINTWEEMKRVMKRRFVPSSYQRDLQNLLQLFKQGKKSVDEYCQEMELLLVRNQRRSRVNHGKIYLRVLSVTAEREENGQSHNLFHTRGMIKDKLCCIIVDNGSYNNIASQELVDILELKSRRHPSPYEM